MAAIGDIRLKIFSREKSRIVVLGEVRALNSWRGDISAQHYLATHDPESTIHVGF
jgi:hypothetical protein